jgi:hypothetical protein
MELSPSRLQLRLVAASYAVVAVVSAFLIFVRYLQYVRNPQDVAAAGGMYAGGDLMLEVIIGFLFLLPTIALVFVIRKSESAFTYYAKVLLGLSLTAPISVGLLFIPRPQSVVLGRCDCLSTVCDPHGDRRLHLQPVAGSLSSRSRLISYALLIEGLTFIAIIAGLFLSSKGRHG